MKYKRGYLLNYLFYIITIFFNSNVRFKTRFIKEQNMTEPVFEIISRKRINLTKSQSQNQNSYNNLLQSYINNSYGYYSQMFIKKICVKAQAQYDQMRKFQLRKILSEVIKKYMMTDLQIIYFTHFSNSHSWNYLHPTIQLLNPNLTNQSHQIQCLKLFLHLVCFFIKTYVGLKQDVLALIDFHNQNYPQFPDIYQSWVSKNSQKQFQISPRELNLIYSQFSRNSGHKSNKKDYNQMVDKILDLSTTYSIIHSQQKQAKSKKKSLKTSKPQNSILEKMQSLKYFDSGIWQQQNSLRSDLRFYKKDSFNLGSNVFNEITEKIQESKKQQNSGPRKISLNKKSKAEKDGVNDMARSFFRGKDLGMPGEDLKKNQNSLKDMIPWSFLDANNRSSCIQSLPLPYRNNSNLNISQLF